MRVCCIVVLILASSIPAPAQTPTGDPPPARLIISDRAIAIGLEQQSSVQPAKTRDSLRNGAITGAVVGAVALTLTKVSVCRSLDIFGPEEPCWKTKGTAISAVVGAFIGSVAGAGVDALLARNHRKLIGGPPFALRPSGSITHVE